MFSPSTGILSGENLDIENIQVVEGEIELLGFTPTK